MLTRRRSPWSSLVVHGCVAVAILLVVRPALPRVPTALAVGAVVGALLYVALSNRTAVAFPARPARVVVVLFAIVAAGAAAEEVVWRLGALGTSIRVLPVPAALAAVTLLFALGHLRTQGRRGVATHLVTGSGFGFVYLLSRNVVASAAAHATYNLLVACAAPAARTAQAIVPLRPDPATLSVSHEELCARLQGVKKRYGETVALDGLDLELRRGEVLSLLGPNGAGKSTAVGILLGLRRPDVGGVEVFGRLPSDVSVRGRLGATPQESAFPPTLRVREVARLVAAHYVRGDPPDDLLARFGLTGLAGRQVGGLSGGQRRRLAVALAFAGDPELVVLDEPTAGLDVEARHAVWAAVRGFAAAGGSVLFTTHHLDEAESLASHIVLLAQGRVAMAGSVAEIRERVGLTRVVVPTQPLPSVPSLVRREDGNGRITLVVRDAGAAVQALVEIQADLSLLEVRPLGLEEIFLSLIDGDAE